MASFAIYSCFERGCPTKAYKRMRQCRKLLWVILALSVLIEAARCFSIIEETAQTHVLMPPSPGLPFLLKHRARK